MSNSINLSTSGQQQISSQLSLIIKKLAETGPAKTQFTLPEQPKVRSIQIVEKPTYTALDEAREAKIQLLEAQNQMLLTRLSKFEGTFVAEKQPEKPQLFVPEAVQRAVAAEGENQKLQQVIDELRHESGLLRTELIACQLRENGLQKQVDVLMPQASKYRKAALENMQMRRQLKKPAKEIENEMNGLQNESEIQAAIGAKLQELQEENQQLKAELLFQGKTIETQKQKIQKQQNVMEKLYENRLQLGVDGHLGAQVEVIRGAEEIKALTQQVLELKQDLAAAELRLEEAHEERDSYKAKLQQQQQSLGKSATPFQSKPRRPGAQNLNATKVASEEAAQVLDSLQLKARQIEAAVNDQHLNHLQDMLDNIQWMLLGLHEQTTDQMNDINNTACSFAQTIEFRKGDKVLRKMKQKLLALERVAVKDDEVVRMTRACHEVKQALARLYTD